MLNTSHSALSAILAPVPGKLVGDHSLISKFLKGVQGTGPSLSRFSATWDSDVIVRYLKVLSVDSLKNLPLKVTMLMALTTAQRNQTLHALKLSDMMLSDSGITVHAQNSTSRVRVKF